MAVSDLSVEEKLQKIIENKCEKLETVKADRNREEICTLTTQLDKKKNELKVHQNKWFQSYRRAKTERLQNEIETLRSEINKKNEVKESQGKYIEELEREIKRNKELLEDYRPNTVWEGYPDNLNKTVFEEYAELFKNFIHPITPEEPYINIVMVGETGAGKSSFINTFATALANKNYMKDIYRISPKQTKHKEKSATRKIHLEKLFLNDEPPHLHINFYDIPGIGEKNCVGEEELEMVIDGKLKPDVEIKKASKMKQNPGNINENPTGADKAHCILYIIRATSNLSTDVSKSLEILLKIRNKRIGEDDVRQFVILTSIDEIGVPNNDMEKAYRYGCIRKHCEKISDIFDIDLPHVIPVSNYFMESAPTHAKNAMSLMTLWRVCISSKEFIQRKRKLMR